MVQLRSLSRTRTNAFLLDTGILPACMLMQHMCAWSQQRSEGVSDPLELEVHVVVDHHVGAGMKAPSSGRAALLTGKLPIKRGEDSTELAMSGTDATDGWLQRETNGRDLGEMRVAQQLERNTRKM